VSPKLPRFVVLPSVSRATSMLSPGPERYPLPSNSWSGGSSSSRVPRAANIRLIGKHPNAQSLHRFSSVPVAIAAGIAAIFGSAVGVSFAQPAEA
jgi:hypothetical protein